MHSANNNGLVGVDTLSFFPSSGSSVADDSTSSLAIAYGSSTGRKTTRGGKGPNASYGMLLTVRRAPSAAPILHWKCHLPESDLSGGLLVSPVSRHVVGGGSSGTLYVWNPLQGGDLVRTIPAAHYRAITCMAWSTTTGSTANGTTTTSPWDCHLVTGGADGMVHVFSHLDLVEQSASAGSTQPNNNKSNSSVQPIRTWTKHNLAVTALTPLNGGRMASAAEDGQVVMMELSSGATLAIFQMPDPIRALATDVSSHGRRLFAGSAKGVVHIVDLDEYALHQTVQMGATVVDLPKPQLQAETLESQVFGNPSGRSAARTKHSTAPSFQKELRGHDRAITSLAVWEDEQPDGRSTEYLVSGDEAGLIRVWDTMRACCLRVIHPWSLSGDTNRSSSAVDDSAQLHPVTSIRLMRQESTSRLEYSLGGDPSGSMFGKTSEIKRLRGPNSFTSMISPLQKFMSTHDGSSVPVPYLEPRRDGTANMFSNLNSFSFERALDKRIRRSRTTQQQPSAEFINTTHETNVAEGAETGSPENQDQHAQQDEIARLQNELEEAKATIQRWGIVNNQLMAKLQEHTTSSQP